MMIKKSYFQNRRSFISIVMVLLILTFFAVGGCGMIEMQSHWTAQPININGTDSLLQEMLVPLEDQPVLVAVLNDANYMYLSLVTSDRSLQRQIMFRGLTVWFDRAGSDEKTFGVKFPLGMQMGDFRQMREQMNRELESDRDPGDGRERGENFRMRMPPIDTTELEILGPKETDQQRVKLINLKQLQAKFSLVEGRMQYTLRIPLTDNGSDPYAIGTKPGEIIGLGLETSKMEMRPPGGSDGPGKMGGGFGDSGGDGPDGGDMPPGGGGRRPGGGMREGMQGGRQQSETLSFWAKVHLAGGGM